MSTMRARPWAARTLLAAVLATLVAGGLAACESSSGRELPPPPGGATTPLATATPPAIEEFILTSEGVDATATLDPAHTCFGVGTSPQLAWRGTPPAAQLAVVARDREAGTVHWVVGGIDPATLGFAAGGLPEGAVAATVEDPAVAAEPTTGWVPPCPAGPGDLRTIDIALHTLPEPVVLEPGIPAVEAAALVEGTSTDVAVVIATAAG